MCSAPRTSRTSGATVKHRSTIIGQILDSSSLKQAAEPASPRRRRQPQPKTGTDDGTWIEDDLYQMQMLQSCNPAFVHSLSRHVRVRLFKPGEVITRCGQLASSLLLLIFGMADLQLDGHVARLERGATIDLSAGLPGGRQASEAQVTAVGFCTTCSVPSDKLAEVLEEFPPEKEYFSGLSEIVRTFAEKTGCLTGCELLQGLPADLIARLEGGLQRRVYFPGEHITRQGEEGRALFVVMAGSVSVEILGRCVRRAEATPGEVVTVGELEIIGLRDTYDSSVVALTSCSVGILLQPIFKRLLDNHPDGAKAFSFHLNQRDVGVLVDGEASEKVKLASSQTKKRLSEGGFISKMKCFSGCSSTFIDFLEKHLETQVYPEGSVLIQEGDANCRSIFIIAHGLGKVTANGETLGEVGVGSIVGELAGLGLAKARVATVTAVGMVLAQVLHHHVICRAFEEFPEDLGRVSDFCMSSIVEGEKISRDDMFRDSTVFRGSSPEFIEAMQSKAILRIFLPGDAIVDIGGKDTSMYIMASGRASVMAAEECVTSKGGIRGKEKAAQSELKSLGEVNTGQAFGEMTMLGLTNSRMARVEAKGMCFLWEISQEHHRSMMIRFPEERSRFLELAMRHLDRTVHPRVMSSLVFEHFSRQYRMMMGLCCERSVDIFFEHQTIAREGRKGSTLYLMNCGRAGLEHRDMHLRYVNVGGHFGATNMLGIDSTYDMSLVAKQVCHVIAISRHLFLQVLDRYPNNEAVHLLKSLEQQAKEQTKRCDGLKSKMKVFRTLQMEDVVVVARRCFNEWQNHSSKSRARRLRKKAEMQSYNQEVGRWLEKRREADERIEPRRMMDRLVRHNLEERGPLILPSLGSPIKRPNSSPAVSLDVLPQPTEIRTSCDNVFLNEMMEDWPQPRPSPHYKLRFPRLLHEDLRLITSRKGKQFQPLPAEGDGRLADPHEVPPCSCAASGRAAANASPWNDSPGSGHSDSN